MVAYDALANAVITGDSATVQSEVRKAIDSGADPSDILRHGLIAGMGTVGDRMGSGEMFLPEVLMSSSAMHEGLNILKPLLAESGRSNLGTIVIGTVRGDIHDIGKRLVGLLLEGNGYQVIDLGVDVSEESFLEAIHQYKAQVLGMSALLTTTIPNMGSTIELLKAEGLREQVKVIVGGASVTEEFADSIGADGYAPEAGSAVQWVKSVIG